MNIDKLAGDDASKVKVLATGGGVLNPVLIDYIKSNTDAEIVVPDKLLINYKEALVFALMGVLRVQNKVNVLASFTGADADSISGSLHGDFSKLP
jgi:anhydro-N-acetylmuramic acid kinase